MSKSQDTTLRPSTPTIQRAEPVTAVRYTKVTGGFKITATAKQAGASAAYTVKGYGHDEDTITAVRDEARRKAAEALGWLLG